ncbi:MAG: hypothetical protein JSV24_12020 [Bacteroidales bacterium]|nr:MAG: hypothetical protein JSV24_12020 [Bacteroidales bacterium]
MKIFYNKVFLSHNTAEQVAEGPYRIRDFSGHFPDTDFNGEEYIKLIHDLDYQNYIRESCIAGGYLAEVAVTRESYEAACLAVGCSIVASEQSGFAVVRPPGHHAKRNRADGFCLFNNLAIASMKHVQEGKKVFILDIDGHHGDGTQSIFYESDRVFFCSIHQEYAYPWTGHTYETGEKKGKGFTLNFPLPPGSGDKELLDSVDKAIEKAMKFKPDMVGVSAGFDGYEKDRLLNLNYTLNGYRECGFRLGKAFSNVFAVLEGGYHNDIKECVDSLREGIMKGWENTSSSDPQ